MRLNHCREAGRRAEGWRCDVAHRCHHRGAGRRQRQAVLGSGRQRRRRGGGHCWASGGAGLPFVKRPPATTASWGGTGRAAAPRTCAPATAGCGQTSPSCSRELQHTIRAPAGPTVAQASGGAVAGLCERGGCCGREGMNAGALWQPARPSEPASLELCRAAATSPPPRTATPPRIVRLTCPATTASCLEAGVWSQCNEIGGPGRNGDTAAQAGEREAGARRAANGMC